MAVVVVLPWAPATATVRRSRQSAVMTWARRTTGTPAASAATTSGSSAGTAVDTATRSAPITPAGS